MFSTFALAETNITPVGLSGKQKSMATARVNCPSKRLCRLPCSFDGTQLMAVVHTISTVAPKLHDKRLRAASTNGSHGKKKCRQNFRMKRLLGQSWENKQSGRFVFGVLVASIHKQNTRIFSLFCVLDLGRCAVAWLYFVC